MKLSIKNFTRNKIDFKYLNFTAREVMKFFGYKKRLEISLVIVGTKRMTFLNNKYRKKNKVTDVLSFGNENSKGARKFVMPPGENLDLGEIFICYKQAEKQAKSKKHSIKKEISILLIHGILHLLGFDHVRNKDAEKMQKIEASILNGSQC